LAVALAKAGVDVGLWSADQSAIITPLLPADSNVHRIIGTATEALDRFGETDILHDNGIWLRHNHGLATAAARRGIPRIVSTRGMLEPWAFHHKGFKKTLAWRLYQRRDLKKANCHHATADSEARNVERFGLGVPIVAIPNGVDVPAARRRAQNRPRTVLFLGRVYPIKGLPMLIEAWACVRPQGWQLRIAGPDEAGHQSDLEKVIISKGLSEAVSFVGRLDGEEKESAFFSADLFVLPSYSESFGMVVAEALAHGLPVLTTTGAPWSVLRESGCGWWVDPTVAGIAEGLREATVQDSGTLAAMGERGRRVVSTSFGWQRVGEMMISAYEDMLARRPCAF